MTRDRTGSRDEPAGPRDTRRHNLSLVLRDALERAPASRANLADGTGLTKATVSSLVGELLRTGLLVESRIDDSGRVGRPGRLLEPNGDGVVGIGLEINVDYLAVSVLDLLGRVRHRRVVPRDNRGAGTRRVVQAVGRLGRQALAACESDGLLPGGVVVAVPGLVDVRTGDLIDAPNLGWGRLPFAEMVSAALDRPDLWVGVDNEANLGALGELWQGRGREWGDFFHISGEIGVGGALVLAGQLMRGSGGLAGELGHVQVDPAGPPCPCGGRGCLERLIGQEALLAAAGIDAELATSNGGAGDGGVATLLSRASAGDPRTVGALVAAGTTLGRACATVVNLLNPATIVLGGIYAPLAPWILPPLEQALQQGGHVARAGAVRLAVSELGPDAAVRGAASCVLRRILADPYLVPQRPLPGSTAGSTDSTAAGGTDSTGTDSTGTAPALAPA